MCRERTCAISPKDGCYRCVGRGSLGSPLNCSPELLRPLAEVSTGLVPRRIVEDGTLLCKQFQCFACTREDVQCHWGTSAIEAQVKGRSIVCAPAALL